MSTSEIPDLKLSILELGILEDEDLGVALHTCWATIFIRNQEHPVFARERGVTSLENLSHWFTELSPDARGAIWKGVIDLLKVVRLSSTYNPTGEFRFIAASCLMACIHRLALESFDHRHNI